MDILSSLRMEKGKITISSLADRSDEKEFWLGKSPLERLEAVEIMREIIYGYDPTADRLQRILEVAPFPAR